MLDVAARHGVKAITERFADGEGERGGGEGEEEPGAVSGGAGELRFCQDERRRGLRLSPLLCFGEGRPAAGRWVDWLRLEEGR